MALFYFENSSKRVENQHAENVLFKLVQHVPKTETLHRKRLSLESEKHPTVVRVTNTDMVLGLFSRGNDSVKRHNMDIAEQKLVGLI